MMARNRPPCCSSPSSMCYWFAASLVVWGGLSLVGVYWHPLHGSSAATILLAAAAGCLANWVRNRTLHCAITGPVLLIAGGAFLLSAVTNVRLNTSWVWPPVAIGSGVAFLLEWRYARRSASRP